MKKKAAAWRDQIAPRSTHIGLAVAAAGNCSGRAIACFGIIERIYKYQKRAVSPRSFGVSGIMEVVAHE